MTQAPPAVLLPGLSASALQALQGFSAQQLQALSLADLEGLGLRGEELRKVYRALREQTVNACQTAEWSPQLTPQPSGGLRWASREPAGLVSSPAAAPPDAPTRRRRNLARGQPTLLQDG